MASHAAPDNPTFPPFNANAYPAWSADQPHSSMLHPDAPLPDPDLVSARQKLRDGAHLTFVDEGTGEIELGGYRELVDGDVQRNAQLAGGTIIAHVTPLSEGGEVRTTRAPAYWQAVEELPSPTQMALTSELPPIPVDLAAETVFGDGPEIRSHRRGCFPLVKVASYLGVAAAGTALIVFGVQQQLGR